MKNMKKNRFVGLISGVCFSIAALAANAGDHAHATHWGYAGHEGPEFWGDLDPKFSTCKTGQRQSPINLTKMQTGQHEPIQFHYKTSKMSVLNNGHTVQANFDDGSYMEVDGKHYNLKQVHFHTPSENHLEGHSYPMEAHFVHATDNGDLAVIAVLIREGDKDPFIQKIWNHMPDKPTKATDSGETFNAMQYLPANKDYYLFSGSLTTPPCTEGVRWMVMKDAAYASHEQVTKFTATIGENNRPIQALHARTVIK